MKKEEFIEKFIKDEYYVIKNSDNCGAIFLYKHINCHTSTGVPRGIIIKNIKRGNGCGAGYCSDDCALNNKREVRTILLSYETYKTINKVCKRELLIEKI